MADFFSLGSANYPQENPKFYNSNSTPESSNWHLYSTIDFQQRQQPQNHADAPYDLPAAGGGGCRFISFSGDGGSGSGGGGVSCQDCGNQAKKDCPHMRCRTCCKSQGLECQTHVKSTWVPAAKRRERSDHHHHNHRLHLDLKRNRSQHPHNHNHNYDVNDNSHILVNHIPFNSSSSTSSGLEVGNLPTEVNTQANFRCVRVSSLGDGDDQFAYKASVNIGGHIFKGILYDQGPEESHYNSSGGSAPITTTSPVYYYTAATNSLYPSLPGNDYLDTMQLFHQIPKT